MPSRAPVPEDAVRNRAAAARQAKLKAKREAWKKEEVAKRARNAERARKRRRGEEASSDEDPESGPDDGDSEEGDEEEDEDWEAILDGSPPNVEVVPSPLASKETTGTSQGPS